MAKASIARKAALQQLSSSKNLIMPPVFKTRDKAEADAQQRRHNWALTPRQRLALAVRLNEYARLLCAANPANAPVLPPHGRRVFKSAAPIPHRGR